MLCFLLSVCLCFPLCLRLWSLLCFRRRVHCFLFDVREHIERMIVVDVDNDDGYDVDDCVGDGVDGGDDGDVGVVVDVVYVALLQVFWLKCAVADAIER